MSFVTRVSSAGCVAALFALALAVSAFAQDKGKTPPAAGSPAVAAPPAQTTTPPAEPEPPAVNWTVNCENAGAGLECKASHVIVTAQTRQLLLAVTVSKPAGGKDGAMLFRLPHGLFNPAGITLAIDDQKPDRIEIQTCDATGCYAGAPLPPERLAAMTSGSNLKIVFQDLKKQNITVTVPLKGFDEAFKKL
ncbi:MAG: invasion associated locus B family protein [Hyphomicrobium sp.]|jgi:invasion protein IalB|nr:invasion associated locus B family protein [Hyphomicrobium sp.]